MISPIAVTKDREAAMWKVTIPCRCGDPLDLWFVGYYRTGKVKVEAAHTGLSGMYTSENLVMADVMNQVRKVMRDSCAMPWSIADHAKMLMVKL